MNYDLAAWYVQTLTGSVDTVMDWRCIHDQRKDLPAHNYRGSLREQWQILTDYNQKGYGIFCAINALDGQGRELQNVQFIRTHVVDLDSLTAPADFDRASQAGANFVVQSSANKFHVYFRVQPYVGNEFYTLQQRKIAQLYNGDKKIIDATRVMRVPGFMHLKGEPVLVKTWPLVSFNYVRTAEQFGAELANINVIDHFSARSPLGTKEMQAPSLEWLKYALSLVDPNQLDRGEWLSISAAFKQAGWTHTDEQTLLSIWFEWCEKYDKNEPGENLKLWNSVHDTETGWATFERRTAVRAYIDFGMKTAPAPVLIPAQTQNVEPQYGEILTDNDCREWFKDCFFVERLGQIVSRQGRFMNSTQFNGRYGGKQFIISSTGKLTDEPWKAALRSTCWTIPKVDHIRFLPDKQTFNVIVDGLGRRGLNIYIPATVDARQGDVSPWLNWFDKILPNKNDQRIFFSYLAHCVKFPGYKIPWAPMLQSTEGIGKTVFRELMAHALGDMYVYSPKAPELVKSGSTFNAWQRNKLMILVDEIKIDERRELIEILKPMIADARVEIQSKGVDQDMEDNPANWLFFSNYKDAIPINSNGRRYCIFFSAMQSAADLIAAGMDRTYFNNFWHWLREGGGMQAVTHWLLTYPIERGQIDMRAPETSSYSEAIMISRSPLEIAISNAIADQVGGFKGGFVSSLCVLKKAKSAGIRTPSNTVVAQCLTYMGYVSLGRCGRAYFQEDPVEISEIFAVRSDMRVEDYGRVQGYE